MLVIISSSDFISERYLVNIGGGKVQVSVDEDLCIACGLCADTCPDVFDLGDDDDVAQVIVDVVPEESEDLCEQAVEECPTEAIIIEE
jgi:ferredoxin